MQENNAMKLSKQVETWLYIKSQTHNDDADSCHDFIWFIWVTCRSLVLIGVYTPKFASGRTV